MAVSSIYYAFAVAFIIVSLICLIMFFVYILFIWEKYYEKAWDSEKEKDITVLKEGVKEGDVPIVFRAESWYWWHIGIGISSLIAGVVLIGIGAEKWEEEHGMRFLIE
jgi:uncharacterized membrane protein